MYNLLIADDEEIERRALRTLIQKNYKDTFQISEAKNGREAIEISEKIKPQVIIMDIKMPGINGIEAIKEIRKNFSDTYFIIISAYDYFSYAREAMECNVKEYILKPFNKQDITEKIKNAIIELERNRDKRIKELELKEKLYSVLPAIKNEISNGIIYDRLQLVNYKQYLEMLHMDLGLGYCVLVKKRSDTCENIEKIKEYIDEFYRGFCNSLVYQIDMEVICVFCEVKKEYTKESQDCLVIARRLLHYMCERFDINTYIGIGTIKEGIENLKQSYKEAKDSIIKCSEKNKIILYEKENVEYDKSEKNVAQKIQENIAQKDEEKENNKIVKEALKYINNNFNKEITLELIASEVNLSTYHLSKVFKEKVGINFIDYLTEYRISKAKEMLKDGRYNIKEICYTVGYSDPNYFSRVFKKAEGMSPTEYKSIV